MYYFLGYVLIRIRLREECDCYHSYRATASPLVSRSLFHLPTSGYFSDIRIRTVFALQSNFEKISKDISPNRSKRCVQFFSILLVLLFWLKAGH